MSRVCVDPTVYELTPHWVAMGLETTDQVRQEVLWQASVNGDVPLHVDACPYCADLLESLRKLRETLAAQDGPVAMAACPDAATLSAYHYGELRSDGVRDHLKKCPACREDLAFLARSQEQRDKVIPIRRRVLYMAIAAAAVVAAIIPWPWLKPHKPDATVAVTWSPNPKWAAMAEIPPVDHEKLMKYSPEDHHSRLEQVMAAYDKGDYKKAGEYAQIIVNVVQDPSAEYLLGMSLYHQGKVKEAFAAMKMAEKERPAPYICYTTLQFALLAGDRVTVEREAHHAGGHMEYAQKCHEILAKL